MTPFNRIVVPPADLASFLRTEEAEKLTFTELQSLLYDRLYRSGAVRHLDGSRARRRRARDRQTGRRASTRTSARSNNRASNRTRTAANNRSRPRQRQRAAR